MKITAFTCSSQKPTASPLLGSFEKQQRDRRAGRTTGEHSVFFYTFIFLADFGMNNSMIWLRFRKSATGDENGEAVLHYQRICPGFHDS